MANKWTCKQVVALVLLSLTALVLLNVWFAMPAKAQRYAVVATCGTFTGAAPAVGSAGIITMDQTGVLCTSSSGGGGGGGAVTVANGADVAQGTTTDAACGTDAGTCTALSLIKRTNTNISTLVTNLGTANSNGQAVMAGSSPVVIASNQSAVPVTIGAVTTGGSTAYTPFVPTASDNHQTVKNGAGTVYSMSVSNNSATKNYARLYDAGTGFNGCNSATGVIFAFEIPPTDGGFSIQPGGAPGMAFSTGLSLCITSGFGLTDTTNATATAMYVNVAYK